MERLAGVRVIIPPPDQRKPVRVFRRYRINGRVFSVLIATGEQWQLPCGRWFGRFQTSIPMRWRPE